VALALGAGGLAAALAVGGVGRRGEAAEVHHLTYELVGDLIALCVPCHRRPHPSEFFFTGASTTH